MTYCSHCGLIIETYDCPVCGFKNYRPEKPGEIVPKKIPVPNLSEPVMPVHDIAYSHNCPKKSAHMLAGGIGAFIMAIAAIILGILRLGNVASV
ncbi:MAG: hypothetical protein Q7J68_03325, partial [Thermoplasmata archaeon]|nr:hypothetical protein [Thermoplasmata archaeon]